MNLFILSWSFAQQYPEQFIFQATGCFSTYNYHRNFEILTYLEEMDEKYEKSGENAGKHQQKVTF